MSSKFHKFSGIAKWARVKTPNKFDKYTINLYVDAGTRKAIRELGTRLTFREDDEGFFVTFRRDHSKQMGTKLVEFGPPEVIYLGEDFDGYIGNGSHVTLDVEVYEWDHPEHGKGKGTRLHKVIIDELVEWEPEDKDDEEEHTPAPEVIATPKPKTRGARAEIPF